MKPNNTEIGWFRRAIGDGCRQVLIMLPIIYVIVLFQEGWEHAAYDAIFGALLIIPLVWLTRNWR